MGLAIPMKATFFITYIMVDGWAGVAAEIFRLVPLIIYHLKNVFLVKTEKDREEAMDPGSLAWPITEPRLQLYFLLGLVYSTVTPILLPFIIVFFAFAYLVFRHQVTSFFLSKGYSFELYTYKMNLCHVAPLVIQTCKITVELTIKRVKYPKVNGSQVACFDLILLAVARETRKTSNVPNGSKKFLDRKCPGSTADLFQPKIKKIHFDLYCYTNF